jgi:hypothetical protein
MRRKQVCSLSSTFMDWSRNVWSAARLQGEVWSNFNTEVPLNLKSTWLPMMGELAIVAESPASDERPVPDAGLLLAFWRVLLVGQRFYAGELFAL